ncbi:MULTISPECIES: hypothetical protein [Brenneria]|uniref:DUF2730 domain-containing protein n=2 Tax=Brenneria TaxID=71655 RepID=A0A2U1UWI1_9GAMM|nr:MULTISPECIES: hypothetical protein [Brenneria]EHD22635.1 hypothetical protein BrE312_3270 [Brenneria sp. EniD312]MDX5630351.1 hypothetical protein [Brenneria sp. L3-3Z]MDX5697496.1 hypothetical protein [Brenneria sp. L4-2C]MEC5344662.1 hypothetical protein [Brenneria populi Li et al. 2015]PWC25998.1 hypothetical protein DDT54_01345 [Brenneria nigrifluens DSM 30175 = ATCC 13028]
MKMEVEFWQLVGLLLGFLGFVFTIAKMFFSQLEKRQTELVDTLENSLREFNGSLTGLERDLMALKADLPLNYVRREDYVRGQTVIEAKLDALYNKLELVQQRGRQ